MTATASARKTNGEYKPLVKFPGNSRRKSLVVEQSPERRDFHNGHEWVPGNKYARGNVYASREEAVAAAQRYIDQQLQRAIADRARQIELYGGMGRHLKWADATVALWGGSADADNG